MSVNKINRSDSASPLLPNSAVPEARGPTKPRHPNIFSKSLFSKAPKNSSTSMAPRDTTPLLSAEQRATHSDGSVPEARSGSRKLSSSLMSRAQKVASSGAKVVSSGMHQAGKVMSSAYQALNQPNHTSNYSAYTRLEQNDAAHYGAKPSSTPPQTPPRHSVDLRPASPQVPTTVRPMTPKEEAAAQPRPQEAPANSRPAPYFDAPGQAAVGRKPLGPVPQRPPQGRAETPLGENARPLVNGQGGKPHGTDPTPGRDAPPMPSSRLLSPLGTHTGNVPQATVRHRPATGGTENANPNVSQPSQRAVVKANLPAFTKIFEGGRMDRTLEPKQLVKAMVGLSKGTGFEQDVHQEIASNPQWGQQMQQRWNTLRNSVADARDGGNPQVPSLEHMVTKRPMTFINFVANGDEESFDKLMRPRSQQQATPAQTPAAPEVHAHAQSARPQGRDDVRPQSSRTEHAVQRPVRNESKPVDERTQLTATLRNLDQQIAASELKGKQILSRMFDPATIGPAVAAATRESYAHKAQHNELIAARNQVQAQLQHVGTNAAAGQLVGKLKDVDGKIAQLEQRAGELNTVMKRSPEGSERWVSARREKNSLRPAWKELTSQRADMQAKLEGLRPEFQQARELAKGLAELAKVQGGEMRQSRDGSRIYLDGATIENHYDRFDQSRHLLNKRGDLENAQQQLNKLINSGMLEGIAPNERRELKALAELNIGQQFRELNDLKDTVAQIRGALKSMGAGGLYDGIRTTPEQRAHDAAEERRNAQEELDNNY